MPLKSHSNVAVLVDHSLATANSISVRLGGKGYSIYRYNGRALKPESVGKQTAPAASSSDSHKRGVVKRIKQVDSGRIIVFRYAKVGDLAEARRHVPATAGRRQSLIAVTTPEIFNQPDLRSTLQEARVEPYLVPAGKFKVDEITDWIDKLIAYQPEREAPAVVAPPAATQNEHQELDLSKDLRDSQNGRLDARPIARLLGISLTDLATKVCGVSKQALSQRPSSGKIQDQLKPLEEIAQLLHWCGGDESKLRAWLQRPNRDFPLVDGCTPSPLDLILRGHAEIVANKVHNLRTGHPA